MRLITRSDFDGLACGALLLEAKVIDSWTFAHPKDIQDGLVPVTEMTYWQTFRLHRAADCGLTTTQAKKKDLR